MRKIPITKIANEIKRGNSINKSLLGTGNYPAIHFSCLFKHQLKMTNCRFFVNPELVKSKVYCNYGDLLLTANSETKKEIGKALVYLGKDKPLVGNDIIIVRHNQNPMYLAYLFTTRCVRRQIEMVSRGSTVYGLPLSMIKKIVVPFVPLKRQDEVSKLLNNLNEKVVALESEIKALNENRNKQYAYLSNQLLS